MKLPTNKSIDAFKIDVNGAVSSLKEPKTQRSIISFQ